VRGSASLLGFFLAGRAHAYEMGVYFLREITTALERSDFQRRDGKTIVFGGLI